MAATNNRKAKLEIGRKRLLGLVPNRGRSVYCRRRSRLADVAEVLQSLEPRRLLSLSVSLEAGELTVVGTQEADEIIVETDKKLLYVRFGGDIEFSAPRKTIKSIIVRGRLGDDRITIGPTVAATGQLGGGGGDDLLTGGRKSWEIAGDAGQDTLLGGSGRDVFSGGEGIDTIDYSARTVRVWVTLDGKPNDGTPPKGKTKGERDNVGVDVENIIGGSASDRLTGSDARNVLTGGRGNDMIMGGGGDDVLAGDQGADQLFGGAGDDVLIAIDHRFEDKLEGGEGYDVAAFDSVLNSVSSDALLGIESEIAVPPRTTAAA